MLFSILHFVVRSNSHVQYTPLEEWCYAAWDMEITFYSTVVIIYVWIPVKYIFFLCSSAPQRYIMLSLWEPLAIYRLFYKNLFYAALNWMKNPFFCILNNLTLSLSPPHKIIPYLIQIWNFVKYIFLKIINLSQLSVTGSCRISCLILNIKTACGFSILDYLRYNSKELNFRCVNDFKIFKICFSYN